MAKVICFHNPEEENGYLSNWYLSDFTMDGIKYTSMEQYMMYQKAKVFQDDASAEKILSTTDVAKIKAFGRGVKNYNDVVWNGMRQVIIYRGLLEKFRQNPELKEMLLSTGDKILAECAVQDKIWAIGWPMNAPEAQNINQWKGQNLLGFALMMVRQQLRDPLYQLS